jgi:hypothetical protein
MSDVTIKIKRSLTPGNVPADLELGELAINIPDKKIYIGDNSTDNIALIVDGNATGGSGNPAGNDTELQFNDGGVFGSSSLLTWEDSASCGSGCTTSFLQLKDRAGIKLYEDSANGTNFISFIAPSSLTSNYGPYVLPAPTSTVNSYLALTSASNGVYTLNWVKAIVADLEGTVNNVTLTAPATAATITVGDNKTFTVNNTLSFSGTDAASIAFGTGGTVAYVSGSDTQVMFNDGGSALGGDAGLTYNKTTDTLTVGGDLIVNGGDISVTTGLVFNLINTNVASLNIGGAASSITIGDATTATTTLRGGTLVGNTATQNVFNTTATTLNAFGAATNLAIGYNSTNSSTMNISTGVVGSSNTKTVNVGTGGGAGSTTNITIGALAGTSTITLAGDIHITGNMIVSGYIETDTGIRGNTDTEEEYLGIGMELDGGTY